MSRPELETVELESLISALLLRRGLDLRGYARGPLCRRLLEVVEEEELESLSELQGRALRDDACFERVAQRAAVGATSMFRDAAFYRFLRQEVVPLLRTWPTIRAWVAGCSTGEEVYSLAILLREEGLAERARIHATDRHAGALEIARAGRYPTTHLREFTANYIAGGGKAQFSGYYAASGDMATLDPHLRDGVTFSQHDLAIDGRFNEFQLVLCRNVMIYYQDHVKRRMQALLDESLVPFGVIALGIQEPLPATPPLSFYEVLSASCRIMRKIP